MSKPCRVIVDCQFGSTGKGLIAGWMAKQNEPDTVATAWGANAGHTFIDNHGTKYVHTMLANGIVSPKLRRVLMGPGSTIDPIALGKELHECRGLLGNIDVLIHPNAAVILPVHHEQESQFHAIGSTKKGVGAAIIQRIKRDPNNQNTAATSIGPELAPLVCSADTYRNALNMAGQIQVEGAQGYSLSLYHGFYPYVTSRDISTAQVMADCGIPAHWVTEVIGTLRTYPIRVANRYDANGTQIGWSGPWYPDQREMEWSELGREAELTTVTKLPRRIATFSHQQIVDAVWQLGVTHLFINFCNYLPTRAAIAELVNDINTNISMLRGARGMKPRVMWVGDGPRESDVHAVPFSGIDAAWVKQSNIRSRAEGSQ
jgi:adenylosuccinate synthase